MTSRGNRGWRIADLCVGAAAYAATPIVRAASIAAKPAKLAAGVVLEPPLVPDRWKPARALEAMEQRGREVRGATAAGLVAAADEFIPLVASATLARLDPIELAKQAIDPAQVARELDALVPYATEAILSRVEPVALIEANLSLEQIEKLLDIYLLGVTDAVLNRLDLTELVRERVGLTALTQDVLNDIDLVELTELVIAELDLAAISSSVIDEIDLPSIIRESSSGVAAEVVGNTRDTAATADEAVSAFFSLLRSGRISAGE